MKYKNILKSRLLDENLRGTSPKKSLGQNIVGIMGGVAKSIGGDFLRGQAAGFGIGPRAMRDLGVPGVRIQPGAPGSGSGGDGGGRSSRPAPESLKDKIERFKDTTKSGDPRDPMTRSSSRGSAIDRVGVDPRTGKPNPVPAEVAAQRAEREANRGARMATASALAQKKMTRSSGLAGIPARIVQALPKSQAGRVQLAKQAITALGTAIGAGEGGPGGKRTFATMGDKYSGRLRQPGETGIVNPEQERAIADYAQQYGISRRDAAAIIRGGGF